MLFFKINSDIMFIQSFSVISKEIRNEAYLLKYYTQDRFRDMKSLFRDGIEQPLT
jgi:hypothetical protein